MRSLFPLLCCFLIVTSGCHSPGPEEKPDLLAENIDSTVAPSQDFFLYANGAWIKRTPIPASESNWGVGNLVDEDIYTRLKKLNEETVARTAAKGTIGQKVGDFWFSGMDTVSIEQQKLVPLQPDLRRIAAIQNAADLLNVIAAMHNMYMNVGFADYVGQDDKHADVMAYFLGQGGLGMRNRDYYFNSDSATVKVRTAYRQYIYRSLLSVNPDSTSAHTTAGKVYALESRLAGFSRTREALRDPYRNYNKLSVAQLEKLCGNINWKTYFSLIGVRNVDSVIVGQPEFFSGLNVEFSHTPLEDWKGYLIFRLLSENPDALDSVSRNNAFAYHKTLSGATEQRPRWKQVLDQEQGAMGEALGQLFVKEYFSAEDKSRYVQLVENVRSAFRERIKTLNWMSDSTKIRAYEKLEKISVKVGYPDKWKDMSSLVVDRGPYVLNILRSQSWWRARQINKLGKPVDKTEWGMTPQTYNAYYDPSLNEAVFPAASFFVPGYKTSELDDAFVYGYTAGSLIGHELSHGFDDQGRQFDASGNLKSWWQPADSVAFSVRAEKIILQFNRFNPVDTLHINGKATQGENIADLGGMIVALQAFKKTAAYQRKEKIGGFTPLQRFFLGYAYSWLNEQTKASLASQVMTDPHAPAKERVNGPLANIPEFYEAFDIKPGGPMYQPDSLRVNIW